MDEAKYRKSNHLLVVNGWELLSLQSAVLLACEDLTEEEQESYGLKTLREKLEKAIG